jgi:hypothetical protein
MIILVKNNNSQAIANWQRWRILTVAETCSSMASNYARKMPVDVDQLQSMVTRSNESKRMSTLYPKSAISVFPRYLFRDYGNPCLSQEARDDFRRCTGEFIDLISDSGINRILVELHVSPAKIQKCYI